MRSILIMIVVSWSLLLGACDQMLVGSDPENTPASNFDILCRELDRHYALFEVKRLRWDSLCAAYRTEITPATTDRELFSILQSLLAHLGDAHVTLTTPFGTFSADTSYDDTSGLYERGIVLYDYLGGAFDTTSEARIYYGRIPEGNIGYLQIPTFAGPIDIVPGLSRWATDIDDVLARLGDVDGMIIDVRDNDGGNTYNASYIASRFADTRRLYQQSYSRNGSEHDDFASAFPQYIQPAGPLRFQGPVVLLTNGRSISGAEWFTQAMRQFPNVTVVGDTTAGNLSGRMERELPNGWRYSISVQKIISSEGICYEGLGIPPDVPVATTRDDIRAGRDPILERAIELARK